MKTPTRSQLLAYADWWFGFTDDSAEINATRLWLWTAFHNWGRLGEIAQSIAYDNTEGP